MATLTLSPIVFNASAYTGEVMSETLLAGLPEEIGNVRFAKFKDGKNVSVLLFNKGKDTPVSQISCSSPLSAVLKAKKLAGVSTKKLLGAVLGCPVHQLTAKTGEKYLSIVQPATFDPESLDIDREGAVNYEALSAL